MKKRILTQEELSVAARGVSYLRAEEGGISFHRFTEEQEELYRIRSADFYIRTHSTSGVKLSFVTDSESLFLSVRISKGSSRYYCSFDLAVNGEVVDSMNNFEGIPLQPDYTRQPFPLGEMQKEFSLPAGEKHIEIFFPWSNKALLTELSLSEGASFLPAKAQKKLLAFGDSITHGYDALHPTEKYVTRLARALGLEEHNKAIGGEIFFPELAASKETYEPDYVTVAYGTNDWGKCEREVAEQNCRSFYRNLSENYPNARIFALTPIWRKDYEGPRAFGAFSEMADLISDAVRDLKNVTVIPGFDLVPHQDTLFADFRLHPNSEGFSCYGENLEKQLRDLIG